MSERAPGRETQDAWRRARRRVARELHPDRGGDLDAYLAAMAEVDRQYRPAPVSGRSRRRTRLMRRLKAWRSRRRHWIEL